MDVAEALERRQRDALVPINPLATNVSNDRVARVGHPAGFRVERQFERQLSGEDELPFLAGSTQWVLEPNS